MKIVQINTFSNGSTGNIMMNIHKELLKKGVDSYVVWGRGRKSQNQNEIYMNDKLGVYFHAFYSRITGKTGFASKISTKKLLKRLDEINPDIIHLHNLHGYYINIEMLFNYIKNKHIKVVWTLHDCWAFTGQCPHFTLCKCDKWKNGCNKCPMIDQYPKTFIDKSEWNYKMKKKLFTCIEDLTIVTPSLWLSKLVKQSFLKEYPVKVINNGVDTSIFKPTSSNFREKYHLEDKKIVLGVASVWDKRKGLNDFIELSKILDDEYKIVLIGLSKKQIRNLPSNILGITRTENQQELAGIYGASDVFLNLSVEESFGLTTVEAYLCGSKVIAYNSTASRDICKEINGTLVEAHDLIGLKDIIKNFAQSNNDNIVVNYESTNMLKQYITLYDSR